MTRWRWVQLNVGLIRSGGEALPSARALFARLEPLVNHWRRDGWLRCFFFMRKPPDVRLRFLTTAEQQVARQLRLEVLDLQREAVIQRFFFSKYQPETCRFGGAKAMNRVHAYFDVDTSMWLELDRIHQGGLQMLVPQVLIPAVLQDLFARALADEMSVLAAWRSLRSLIPVSSRAVVPEVDSIAAQAMAICSLRHEERVRVLRRYFEANKALAESLIRLSMAGDLTRGLTEVLAAVGLFSFHRHGLDGSSSGVLIEAMIHALERNLYGF